MTGRTRPRRRAVLAFGGNALIRHGEDGDQRRQVARADALARFLVRIVRRGYDLVLVHGNGPQVGNLLIQVEEAVNKVPPPSVDVCVAQYGGGAMLDIANIARGHDVRFVTTDHASPYAARNLAAKSASSDVLLFTEPGCVPDANWIRAHVDAIQSGATVSVGHIAPIHDFWREPDGAIVVEKLVTGGSLRSLLATGPASPEQVAEIVSRLAIPLARAHEIGIVHGSVTLDNVLLDADGSPLLTDFGMSSGRSSRPADDIAGLVTCAAQLLAGSDDPLPRLVERLDPGLAVIVGVLEATDPVAVSWEADAALAKGQPKGPLHGVPFTVKDSFDTAGVVSTGGTLGRKDFVPGKDATVVARARAAGAILLGKTNTPEFTLGGGGRGTVNLVYGLTKNPYDPMYQPSGSSGGAGAIVAAAGAYFDIGSDYGGSIRGPAFANGIAGIKPTLGRVPYYPGQTDRTVAGPIARSAADAALLMNVIARPDGRDWQELPPDETDYVAALDGGVEGLRVAASASFGYERVDPEVRRGFERGVGRLEALGARVEPVESIGFDVFDIYMIQATLRLRETRLSMQPEALARRSLRLRLRVKRGTPILRRSWALRLLAARSRRSGPCKRCTAHCWPRSACYRPSCPC